MEIWVYRIKPLGEAEAATWVHKDTQTKTSGLRVQAILRGVKGVMLLLRIAELILINVALDSILVNSEVTLGRLMKDTMSEATGIFREEVGTITTRGSEILITILGQTRRECRGL